MFPAPPPVPKFGAPARVPLKGLTYAARSGAATALLASAPTIASAAAMVRPSRRIAFACCIPSTGCRKRPAWALAREPYRASGSGRQGWFRSESHGGNGLASEYGLGVLLANSRLSRIAPVSREMILNFVAQHSLGLPKSY